MIPGVHVDQRSLMAGVEEKLRPTLRDGGAAGTEGLVILLPRTSCLRGGCEGVHR